MDEKKLTIYHFTDPLCFWCYAMEPEMRKLRVLLGDQLDYRIVMGVLSSDVHEIIGFDALSEARFELIRNQLAANIAAAARNIGMPIAPDFMMNCKPEELVSLPLSMAYCAMKATDESQAEGYLRRIRERVYAEGRSLPDVDALVELAAEFPVDPEEFRDNLENGAAAAELQEGVSACRSYNIFAFPTLILEYGSQRSAMNGYYNFDALRQAIAQVSDGEIALSDAEYSLNAVESYVDRFGKAAAREIQVMFSLNDYQLNNVMMDLVGTGRYRTEPCGSSYFALPR